MRPAPRLTRRLLQLSLALVLLGVGMGAVIASGLGNIPRDVLNEGLARRTGLSIGVVAMIVAACALLVWIPLRQRLGLGALGYVLVLGPVADLTLTLLPDAPAMPQRAGLLVGGLALYALGTAMLLGARFGATPRDGLMVGLSARTRRPARLVRTCLEVTVVVVGWQLGGTVGVGTALYAVAMGPLTHLFLRSVRVALPPRTGSGTRTTARTPARPVVAGRVPPGRTRAAGDRDVARPSTRAANRPMSVARTAPRPRTEVTVRRRPARAS